MFLALPFGLAIGLVVGSVGGGGAILALPILVYILGEGVSPASTASLIVVAIAASAGAGSQALDRKVCWRIALTFSAPAAVGAYVGTTASGAVSPRGLILAFVPVMLAAAVLTWLRSEAAESDEGGEAPDCPSSDPTRVLLAGLGVGAMTGFFGVGGGFLIVPALTALIGLGLRRSIATSLVIITLTGVVALLSHLTAGAEPDWPLTALLCGAAAVGALVGTSIGRRLPTRVLARSFGVVVALVALFLLVDVLLLGGPPVG